MVSRCLVAAVYGIEVRPEKRAGQILPTSSPLSSRDLHGIMSALMNTNSKRQSVWFGTIAWLAGLLVLVAGLMGGGWFALADETQGVEPAAKAASAAQAATPVPVVVNNRTIFEMRVPFLGYSPAERAAGAERRIAAALSKGGPGVVTTAKLAEGIAVQIDGALVFLISPGDVTALAGETLESTAATAVANLSTAIDETREARNLKLMLLALARAAVATLVFGLALWGVIVGNRWLDARLSAAVETHAEKLKLAGVVAVNPRYLLIITHRVVVFAAWGFALMATDLWLTFTLVQFPYTRPWGEGLQNFLIDTLVTVLRGILSAVPGLVIVVIIFVITRFLVQLAHTFFDRFAEGRATWGWLDVDTAGPTRRIVTVVLWLFALAMAYPYLPGSQTDAFRGLSVLVGLMISLGASNLVGQAASGLILIYSRTLKPGEYVKIGDTQGTVTDLGMFATRVETGMGAEVVLPNSFVLSTSTINYSRTTGEKGYILDASVTIGYDAPWRQVHAMLLEAARRTHEVMDTPAPYVIQTALSDFYVEYRLVAQAGSSAPVKRARAMSDLHANIQDVFNEHGVQILSPHFMIQPPQPVVVPKEKWYAAPAVKPSNADSTTKQ